VPRTRPRSQVPPARRARRGDEQSERGKDHLALPDPITHGTDRASHEVCA